MGWAIALHGGAGDIPKNLPPERRQPREDGLRRALEVGISALKSHASALDAVELVVFYIFYIHTYITYTPSVPLISRHVKKNYKTTLLRRIKVRADSPKRTEGVLHHFISCVLY